jgi:hypothetical protein
MTKIENILGDFYDAWRAQDVELLGTYLPHEFSHMVYVPKDVHPLGGLCQGKAAALQRFAVVARDHDLLGYDTSDLLIHKNRAALEIIGHYRHKATALEIETTIVNFWTFEDGWPIMLAEYHDIDRVQAFAAKLAALNRLPGA